MMVHLYNAEGQRVAKGTLTAFSCNLTPDPATGVPANCFALSRESVLGPSGEQLAETDGSGNWKHTNVYAAGQLIATYDTAGLHYQLADWLGTRRVQTDFAGNTEETCTSLPYGNALNCQTTSLSTAGDATEHHFTGKERDTESGNDYFLARYYGSSMGRFVSPDPSGLMFADPGNPQSLNLYSYAWNNPLKFIDPNGLDNCTDSNGNVIPDDKGGDNDTNCANVHGTWNVFTPPANVKNVTPPAQGSNLVYDQEVATDAVWLKNHPAPQSLAPTPQQYIQAIANAAPTICGGGVFASQGGERSIGVAEGAVGGIAAYDTREGVSAGGVVEAGVGDGLQGGGGYIKGTKGSETFAFEGANVDVGAVGVSGGAVVFTTGGAGVYVGGQAAGRMREVGAYVNITNNANCITRHK